MSYFLTTILWKTAEVLQPFLKAPPDDPGLLLAWGTPWFERAVRAARRIFRLLIEQNANNPSVHFFLGQAYAQDGDYCECVKRIQAALQIDSRLPEVHYFMGLVHLRQSDFESAASEFRSELEIRPADPVVSYHLGYTLLLQGHAEQAAGLLRASWFRPSLIMKWRASNSAARSCSKAMLPAPSRVSRLQKKLFPERDATYFQLSQGLPPRRPPGGSATGPRGLSKAH